VKKLVFCAYDKPESIGGPVTWLMHLLPFLKKNGFDVTCLIMFHVSDTGPLYKHLKSSGISCKTTPYLPSTQDNIQWILSCLKDIKPDIFLPNLVVAGYYAARWAQEAGMYTIGMSHSDDPFYHALQAEFLEGSKKFKLDGMVCVSDELEQQLQPDSKDDGRIIKKIPYGVSIPDSKSHFDAEKLRVVYVGRLAEEQKRITEVATAFCKMVSQLSNVEAIFYGDGPDRSNVEKILASHGNTVPVTMAGSVPVDKIQEALLQAHVIVLLSDFEGLPIAILEAMACGVVPVCLHMNSGISEQIENGVTGFIVNDRDTHFIETIKLLSKDKILWNQMSINAKNYISNHFRIEKSHENWVRFLNQIPQRQQTQIIIPKHMELPPVHKELARADRRKPKEPYLIAQLLKTFYVKARIKLGAYKRIVLNPIKSQK